MSADVDINVPDPVHVTLGVGNITNGQALEVDFGLDTIAAGITVKGAKLEPVSVFLIGDKDQPLSLAVTGDTTKPLSLALFGAADRPLTFSLVGDDKKPLTFALVGDASRPVTVDLGLDGKLDLGLNDIKIDLGLDNIKADFGLDDINLSLCIGLTQIPSVQVHMPTSSCVGLSLLGIPVFNLSFESQWGLTTQDNPPRIVQGPAPVGAKAAGPLQADVTVTLEPDA